MTLAPSFAAFLSLYREAAAGRNDEWAAQRFRLNDPPGQLGSAPLSTMGIPAAMNTAQSAAAATA